MKMTKMDVLRIALLGTACSLAPVSLFAQMDPMAPPASQTQPNLPQQQLPATTSMQDSAAGSGDTGRMMKDKMFLRKAAEGGMAEVQLGQLAADKADSTDVKAFGQKMVTDHTALNLQMKPIAQAMGVNPPKKLSKDDQAELEKLGSLSGADFDTEYLAYMVKDHHKDLRDFREESETATDPALKDAVTKGAQVIREHTMMVEKLAKDKGVAVPAHKS
jgi:putative membrane protein